MGSADKDVGAKIRAFRQRKKLSLNDLSRATGIAPSNLSSMELGKSSPTLGTLVKIAEAFGMKAGAFLDEVLYGEAIFCPRDKIESVEIMPGVRVQMLTQDVWLRKIDAKILELQSGSEISVESDKNDRFLHCLMGELEAGTGKNTYFLKQGDSLYLSPEAAAHLANRSSQTASLLIVYVKD
ncbi:XRE family transcriptional regulator [Desulfomonile tiedjei]|nr:XRE family transcriptional regulator [Desulfomonile tiedjei]